MKDYTGILGHFPYAGIFIALILGGIGLPFPEDIVLIVTGASVASGSLKLARALIVIYPALIVSDFLLYSSGRKFGRSLFEKNIGKFISRERLEKIESGFNRRRILYIVFGRSLVGVRAQIFLLAGISGMSLPAFLAADAAGALISSSIMLGIGYLGGNSIQIILKDITRVEHVAVTVLVALFAAWIAVRFYKSQSWRLRKYLYGRNARIKDTV